MPTLRRLANKDQRIEICFILMLILAIVTATTVGLSDDEAYYWSWSLKPALSYFDHPPLLAWTLWLSTHVFGKTNFAVRLPALLSFLTSSWLFIRWGAKYHIEWRNIICICISTPLFFVFSWITLPDVLFLPLGLFAIECVLQRKFGLAGFVLGLALLAKWHAFLLIPGLLVTIAFKEQSKKERLIAGLILLGIAAILQTPVLFWNIQHHWISVSYHLVERHGGSWGSLPQSALKGFGFILGFFAFCGLTFIYLAVQFLKTHGWQRQYQLKKEAQDDLILLSLSLPFLIVFLLSAMKGETRIYWAGFALFPLSLLFLKKLRHQPLIHLHKLAVASFCTYAVVLFLALYLPIGAYSRPLIELFRSYDMRMSPRGDLIGWKRWAARESALEQKSSQRTLYLASDFRLASQLLWNSHLDFNQVSSIERIHQYAIWPAPDKSRFSKAVVFGDNRRHFNEAQFNQICRVPLGSKDYFSVELMNRIVKVIEDAQCANLN